MTDIATPPPVAPPTFRFLRSRTDRRLGGVAGGLAVAAGLDPAVVRVALVLAAFTGWGVLAYVVAWIVVPAEDPAAGRLLVPAPEQTARFTRIGLAVVGGLGALQVVGGLIGLTVGSLGLLAGPGFGWGRHGHDFDLGPGGLLGLALIVSGAVVLLRRRGGGETPTAAAAPAPPAFSNSPALPPAPGAVAGPAPAPATPPSGGGGHDFLFLLARVTGWLLALWFLGGVAVASVLWAIGALDLRWPLLPAVTAAGALAVLVRALLRSRRLGVLVLAATALAVPPVLGVVLGQWDGRAGYRSATPATVEELERTYRHAVGQLDLDLSALRIPAGTTTRVKVDMGAGEVRVTVPWDANVRTSGKVGFGEVDLFGRQQHGFGASDEARLVGAAEAGTLELSARARAGRIGVDRAPELLKGGGEPLACTVPAGGGLSECRPTAPQPPGAPPAPGAAYVCKPTEEKGFVTCFPAPPG
jgi:phage shock protein PspC (stress-responsive transcriptional regulator)